MIELVRQKKEMAVRVGAVVNTKEGILWVR